MFPPAVSPPARYSAGRDRSVGFFLALLAEALLIVLVLTFGSSVVNQAGIGTPADVVRFRAVSQHEEVAPEKKAVPEDSPKEPSKPKVAEPQEPVPEPVQPKPPQPRKLPPKPLIPMKPAQVAAADITPPRPAAAAAAAPAAKAQQYGPPDTVGRPSDSAVVSGSGPHGETLYAASWYREPYKDELDGYLSTATGPGWGLIACRTASDYRVEACVPVDEYPTGSNINRAILAAAWQFKVRPPRVGGEPRIGEWVRIRIDYGTRRP